MTSHQFAYAVMTLLDPKVSPEQAARILADLRADRVPQLAERSGTFSTNERRDDDFHNPTPEPSSAPSTIAEPPKKAKKPCDKCGAIGLWWLKTGYDEVKKRDKWALFDDEAATKPHWKTCRERAAE